MWSTPVTLPSGGTWRVIADFTPIAGGANQARTVLGDDVTVAAQAPTRRYRTLRKLRMSTATP